MVNLPSQTPAATTSHRDSEASSRKIKQAHPGGNIIFNYHSLQNGRQLSCSKFSRGTRYSLQDLPSWLKLNACNTRRLKAQSKPAAAVVGGGNEKAVVELGTSVRGKGSNGLGGSPDPEQRLPTGP